MRKTTSALVASTLVLTACGSARDSAVNPANWFGRSQSAAAPAEESTNPLIPTARKGLFRRGREEHNRYKGTPLEEIVDLKIERIPGGAIIRTTGRAARQGIYEVRLTPINEAEEPVDGVLTYRLEGSRPYYKTPVGQAPTREVTAARSLTDQQLRDVRAIRIEGLNNALVLRR